VKLGDLIEEDEKILHSFRVRELSEILTANDVITTDHKKVIVNIHRPSISKFAVIPLGHIKRIDHTSVQSALLCVLAMMFLLLGVWILIEASPVAGIIFMAFGVIVLHFSQYNILEIHAGVDIIKVPSRGWKQNQIIEFMNLIMNLQRKESLKPKEVSTFRTTEFQTQSTPQYNRATTSANRQTESPGPIFPESQSFKPTPQKHFDHADPPRPPRTSR